MCSIFGRVALGASTVVLPLDLLAVAQLRGHDSWGVSSLDGEDLRATSDDLSGYPEDGVTSTGWIIGNTRAEPTTEFVENKRAEDVQPFLAGDLVVAHNGTIANDKELLASVGIDWRVTLDLGRSKVDTARWAVVADARGVDTPEGVLALLGETIGSYGIAVGSRSHGWLVLATNYKPIWTRVVEDDDEVDGPALEWTSVAPRLTGMTYLERLHDGWTMLDPYSALIIDQSGDHAGIEYVSLRDPAILNATGTAPAFASTYATPGVQPRALVVCSGGLDSVTAACMTAYHMDVDLLHITYGARAEAREIEAVTAVAEARGFGLRFLDLTSIFAEIGHSRLTGTWEGAASGEEGAEYAIEWVPARNTILLAVATGMAEAHGYSHLVLGNNVEESGAYPDNEQEFVGRFNDMLPFAVADGKSVTILEPLGGKTKREIVDLGLDARAPLELTWSCYDGGELHCGQCGPCFMRQTAFRMLGTHDPILYATQARADAHAALDPQAD